MIFLLNDYRGVSLKEIAVFLDFKEQAILSKTNIKYHQYFYKHLSSYWIIKYFSLIKCQLRRPIKPLLYSRLCGIELFTDTRKPDKIILEYRQTRGLFKVIKISSYKNDCHYNFDSLLLVNENPIRIINFIGSGLDYNKRELSDEKVYNNYRSLGVSSKNAKIFANGPDWYFNKRNLFNYI